MEQPYVVHGKPHPSADMILKVLERHGYWLEYTENTPERASATLRGPGWATVATATATLETAVERRNGRPLAEPWQRYPKELLAAEALRMCAEEIERKVPDFFTPWEV